MLDYLLSLPGPPAVGTCQVQQEHHDVASVKRMVQGSLCSGSPKNPACWERRAPVGHALHVVVSVQVLERVLPMEHTTRETELQSLPSSHQHWVALLAMQCRVFHTRVLKGEGGNQTPWVTGQPCAATPSQGLPQRALRAVHPESSGNTVSGSADQAGRGTPGMQFLARGNRGLQ